MQRAKVTVSDVQHYRFIQQRDFLYLVDTLIFRLIKLLSICAVHKARQVRVQSPLIHNSGVHTARLNCVT